MRNCVVVLLILAVSFQIQAAGLDDISGSWQGVLSFNGVELRMVFNFEKTDDGYSATLDSPDQGAMGIPVGGVFFDGDSLYIDFPVGAGGYTGVYNSEKEAFVGEWAQGGMTLPLELEKLEQAGGLNRPQEPKKPFPYLEEEVTFPNPEAGITLAGTLTMPVEGEKFPVAVMISGSGPQNRDEELLGHKPFLVIADYLTRRGIAVLRFDDRGTGQSTGTMQGSTSKDFAGDVVSAIEYLKSRSEIDHGKIGLIGHSEGGMIAPMVAAEHDDIAFIILLAGPGVNGDRILVLQTELIFRASGMEETVLRKMIEHKELEHRILSEEADDTAARKRLIEESTAYLANYSAEELEQIGYSEGIVAQRADVYLTPWFRYFMSYEPGPALSRVKCPVLAMNGEKDLQVPPRINLEAIEKALISGENTDYRMFLMPGLNHLFQNCENGTPDEYAQIEETFSPDALEIIGDWISSIVK